MPRSHKPTKVSQVLNQINGGKYSRSSSSPRCAKSPTGSHWWNIATARGENSVGLCRCCGTEQEFANTLEAAVSLRGKR